MRLDGWKVPAVGLVCVALGSAAVYAKGDDKKPEFAMTVAGSAKWAPADPKQPKGIQVAVVSGNPAGPSPVTLMLKFPKGPVPEHWHSSDYSAVVVEGTWKHWVAGKAADAKSGGVGTAWFQPGGSVATAHGDECLADSCTLVLVVQGKFDMTLAPATAPAGKK